MKHLCRHALPGLVLPVATLVFAAAWATAQEKSVRPGINKPFENPDVKEFIGKFEVESREIFTKRQEIVAACKIKPGMAVADIGAGTGLFTRVFAKEVGPKGKVYAVDIAPKFIKHIEKTCTAEGLKNVVGVVCKPDSVELPEKSIDLAFICDTYHHFEFPFKTMASIQRALRPAGRMVLVDFQRIPGVSSEWVLNHVRAGQEVFTKEILSTGFKVVEEPKLLKENYCVVFEKMEPAQGQPPSGRAGKHSSLGPLVPENHSRLLVDAPDPIARHYLIPSRGGLLSPFLLVSLAKASATALLPRRACWEAAARRQKHSSFRGARSGSCRELHP